MRALRSIVVVLAVITAIHSVSYAQTPTIRLYFDDARVAQSKDCPPGGGIDSAFVVAQDFGALLTGAEFSISYPTTMIWLSDFGVPPVTIGDTPTGISMGWATPQDGYGGFVVAKVLFQWNCADCSATDDPVVVKDHPQFGAVRATRWPDYQFIPAIGMTSLVCATVPAEQTTWGHVKALFE